MFMRTCSLLTVLLGLIVALPVTGFAAPVDVATLTQLMIEDQGNDMTLLGLGFGVDPSSPVTFSSNVDLSTTSYSFMSAPGSMYEGQSLTIVASGVYDSTTSLLTTTASITLGATTYIDTGTLDLSVNSNYMNATELTPPMPTPFFAVDVTDDECFEKPGFFEDFCYYTNNGTKIPDSDYLSIVSMSLPGWTFQNYGDFLVSSVGSSPAAGGDGSFTATVSPVPEPSDLTLLAFGISVLTGAKIRLRRNRSIRCSAENLSTEFGYLADGPRVPLGRCGPSLSQT